MMRKNSYFQQMSIGKAGQVKGCILHRLSDVTSQKVFLRRPMLHMTTLRYVLHCTIHYWLQGSKVMMETLTENSDSIHVASIS